VIAIREWPEPFLHDLRMNVLGKYVAGVASRRDAGQELSLLLPSHPLVSLNPNITLGFGIEFPSDGANFSINSRIVNLSAPPGHTVQYSFGIAFHKALDSTARLITTKKNVPRRFAAYPRGRAVGLGVAP
jgi:hypothetical protein